MSIDSYIFFVQEIVGLENVVGVGRKCSWKEYAVQHQIASSILDVMYKENSLKLL